MRKTLAAIAICLLYFSIFSPILPDVKVVSESQTSLANSWDIRYEGDVLPEQATPPWLKVHDGYVSTDGDVLNITTTDESGDKREAEYQMSNIVSRTAGITVEARVRVGFIETGVYPDTGIGIVDGTEGVRVAFLEDRVLDFRNSSNYFLMDTRIEFHVYRLTFQNGIGQLYVDSIHRLSLNIFPNTLNYVGFGDHRFQTEGRNGMSFWDYVRINTQEARPPGAYASVDIDPDGLNLRSMGNWITAYVELELGFDVNAINVSSVLLNGTISVDPLAPSTAADYDSDDVPDLMVKFDRATVAPWIYNSVGMRHQVSMTITGELADGTAFKGTDTIAVIWTGQRAPCKR